MRYLALVWHGVLGLHRDGAKLRIACDRILLRSTESLWISGHDGTPRLT